MAHKQLAFALAFAAFVAVATAHASFDENAFKSALGNFKAKHAVVKNVKCGAAAMQKLNDDHWKMVNECLMTCARNAKDDAGNTAAGFWLEVAGCMNIGSNPAAAAAVITAMTKGS